MIKRNYLIQDIIIFAHTNSVHCHEIHGQEI